MSTRTELDTLIVKIAQIVAEDLKRQAVEEKLAQEVADDVQPEAQELADAVGAWLEGGA